jgi:alkylhydroperoxidase family enzyme
MNGKIGRLRLRFQTSYAASITRSAYCSGRSRPITQRPMTRIPYPDPQTLSPAKLAAWNTKGVLNLQKMGMHAPDKLWTAWRSWASTAAYEPGIEPALRELCIVRIGYLSNCDYEVHHHFDRAIEHGATREQCLAMKTGDVSLLSPAFGAVITFVGELVQNVSPSDATLAAVRAHYTDAQVMEILLLVGAYMTMARIIATYGFGIEEEA